MTRQRVDLRAFQVWDPVEAELRYPSSLRLWSDEVGKSRTIALDPEALRAAFRAEVETFLTEVRDAVFSRRGRHYRVPVGADLGVVLADFLAGTAGSGRGA